MQLRNLFIRIFYDSYVKTHDLSSKLVIILAERTNRHRYKKTKQFY